MKWGMVIDLFKCVGCSACTVVCRAEHGSPPGISFTRVKITEIGKFPHAKMTFLPMSCMHCQHPQCLDVCPTNATSQRDDGIVLVDQKKCIGCGACIVACPYGSRELLKEIQNYYGGNSPTPYESIKQKDFRTGTVIKCNFCLQRLEKGRRPACVETCPAQARTFGDIEDSDSEIAELLKKYKPLSITEDDKSEPAMYYIRG